jgi:hypothetical protein
MRSLCAEAPNLIEGRFQAIEHFVEQPREIGNFVTHVRDRYALAEIVGANPIGRFLDNSHRPQRDLAEDESHHDACNQAQLHQHEADLSVAVHHLLNQRLR